MRPQIQKSDRVRSNDRVRANEGGHDEGLSPAALTFLIFALAACGMAGLISLLPAAGHDQMWLLYVARLMLHGAPLYGPETFETTPPMIIWLSALPVAAAAHLHVAETAMGKLFVIALECLIGFVCVRLLRSMRIVRFNRTVVCWLVFLFVAVFAVMPGRDLGQRDHLLVLLSIPYVFAAAATAEGQPLPRWAAILTGMAALAGLAMKPHQILVVVAVELTLILLRTRKHGWRAPLSLLRPEFLALVISGVAFILGIHLFAPLYFALVPEVWDTYWAFSQWSFAHLVAESIQLHILAVIALALFFVEGWRKASKLTCLLLAAGSASLLAYYVQGTGWYYQQIPSLTFFALALGILLIEFAERRRLTVPRWAPKAAAGLSVLALGLTAHFSGYPFTAARSFPIDAPDPSFFTGLAPGTAVTTLSTTVDYIMPPIYKYDLTLGQRYPLLVMLPAILRSEDPQGGRLKRHLAPARVAELDAFQHAAMREDLARWHPQLVLVERCQDPAVHCQVLEDRHDDLLAWFMRDPGFRAIFANYHYLRSSGAFDAYVPNQVESGTQAGIKMNLRFHRKATPSSYNRIRQSGELKTGMARIYPFRALRYDTSRVRMEDVVTQPYDKISPEMQQGYYERSPYNLIRVILGKHESNDTEPQDFLPAGEQAHNVYTRAAASLGEWRAERILIEEADPALYGYSQTYVVPHSSEVRERRGFIALGHLYDYADKVVYRHEQTFPKHKSDRLALFKATRAYCEQIYMLYSDPAFTTEKLIFGAGKDGKDTRPADLAITDEYGVVHRVWKVTDSNLINLIVTAMADKKLIIADGHHRYETSVAYAKERSEQLKLPLGEPLDPDEKLSPSHLPAPPFPEAAMMMTFVNMDAPGITILPTHRVVFGLENFSSADFITDASRYFDITEITDPATGADLIDRLNKTPGEAFIAATGDGNYILAPKPEEIAPLLEDLPAKQRQLGVAQLHTVVLGQILGLNQETITRLGNVHYIRDASEAVSLVEAGKADVAFLIKPITLDQLRDVSLSGEVMPQKSTDFYPKLLSGLAIYALD